MSNADAGGLTAAVVSALQDFVDAGCPGDVNAYVTDRGLGHPYLDHRRADGADESVHEDFVPCKPPLVPTSKWVPDREGGHAFWYCALPR
jgi:hypothetical protein